VDWFRVAGNTPFAHTADDKLYSLGAGSRMISKGVRELTPAQGGAYALTDDSLLFIADGAGSANRIDGVCASVALPGSIDYIPPLAQDAGSALGVLAREANYCLYRLGFFRDKCEEPLREADAAGIADTLLARQDLSEDVRAILEDMRDGFAAYARWENGENERKPAGNALENALGLYENYMESGGGGA
jgi:hypothetical protein